MTAILIMIISIQDAGEGYLLKLTAECRASQHMLMRVSVGIHREDVDAVIETYH